MKTPKPKVCWAILNPKGKIIELSLTKVAANVFTAYNNGNTIIKGKFVPDEK